MRETSVLIVGAGPSGLATAACLTKLSIPYILLEREDCFASLWKKKTYDRLHLHLPKQFSELPHMKLPINCPKYISKNEFIEYLDNYVAHFGIKPLYQRLVVSADFDEKLNKWRVVSQKVKVKVKGDEEVKEENDEEEIEFFGRFLVVASGETSDVYCPKIEGLSSYKGKVLHSTEYKSGVGYENKSVLVVGAGNSAFEIALDLANHSAHTSILVRNPVHILSRGMVHIALFLLKYLRLKTVDNLLITLSKIVYGDLTKYGMRRPIEGPYYLKESFGKYPIIDVGTFSKIKTGEIQILPVAMTSIKGNEVLFKDGKSYAFDVIIFATGFRRSTFKWLKGDEYLLNEDGIPKPDFPNHWKGKNGLYCVGLARRGLYGAAMDAQNISNDIKLNL